MKLMFAVCNSRYDLLVIPEQRVLLLTDLDRRSTELGDQDLVTGLHTDGNALALFVKCSRSNSEHLGLVKLLDSCLGQEDAGCGLSLRLKTLHQDTVEERSERADGLEGRLRECYSSELIKGAADDVFDDFKYRAYSMRFKVCMR